MTKKPIGFRRIRGRVVPIFDKAIGRRAIALAATTASPIAGVALATSTAKKTRDRPHLGFLGAGYGLQIASGIVSGFPIFKGLKGAALGVGASVGLDTLSTVAFAKAAQSMRASRKEKIKSYAKHQAAGSAIGWGIFGATLLGTKEGRSSLKGFGKGAMSFLKKAKAFL